MGVIYKLKDEVVQFIISQRQDNPLYSCRQLAESASQKFGLHLSKSSVHDVLKESGIITPRGRKPKLKFEIPREKKKQIQAMLSQVKLLSAPIESEAVPVILPEHSVILSETKDLNASKDSSPTEISPEHEGAGKIFLKAVLWDLGIFSEENVKESDWDYYLTYCKGIKVVLENNKDFFIDLPLPIERCIRETADGLINNVKPLIVHKVSDEVFFKACMEAQAGFKINNISIVGQNDHILLELCGIVELERRFIVQNRIFVESYDKNLTKRLKTIFFSQVIDNNNVIDNILNLKGFDSISAEENIVTLLIDDSYNNKTVLQEAAEKLNGMYLRDEQGRLVRVVLRTK